MHALARGVAGTPIVTSADTIFAHVEILGIIDVLVRSRLNTIDDLIIRQGDPALQSFPIET